MKKVWSLYIFRNDYKVLNFPEMKFSRKQTLKSEIQDNEILELIQNFLLDFRSYWPNNLQFDPSAKSVSWRFVQQ